MIALARLNASGQHIRDGEGDGGAAIAHVAGYPIRRDQLGAEVRGLVGLQESFAARMSPS